MELDQVLTALRNADAAGNVEDARQLARIAQQLMAAQPPEEAPKPKTGIGAAIGKGVESIISSGRTALGAATGDAEEAARAGLERGEAINKKYADQVSLQKVKDAYNKDGVLSAAGEALSQIPAALAEQAPNLAAMAGSARLGAMAGSVLGPVGATVGGIGGALLPSLVQQFSGDVERRKSEGLPADVGLSAAAAIPQAGLDVASSLIPFGGRLVQKLTGIPMGALLGRSAESAAKLADERLLTVLAKGVGVGALAEIPTEVAQQMLERAQAGLSLSSPDALREYGETAYQVGLLAPLGAVGRLSERGGARMDVAARQQEEAAKAAEVQQQQDAAAAQQKMTADADPAYAAKLRADYVAANVEMQRLNQAVKALSAEKDPLSVADAKDARVARDTYAKETMQPLVDEIRRVRQLHPGVDFRPPAPVAAPAVAPAATEPVATEPVVAEPVVAEPVVAEPVVTTTPMPEATAAPLTKAQAAEGTVSAPVDELAALQAKTAAAPVVETPVVETPAKKPRAKKAVAEAPVKETPVVEAPVVETPVVEAEAPVEKAPATPPPTLQSFEEQRVKLEAIANDTSQPYKTRVDAKLELAAIPKKIEQLTLEQREEPTTPTGESIPRTAISFEPRRRIMDAIAKEADYAPDKRRELEALSNDFSQPYNVRAAAKTKLETYNAKVQRTIANKEKTLGKDVELYAETRGKIAEAENILANELLNQKELTRLRGGKITRAELEAPKRAKLAGTLARLNAELTVRADKIAARSGLTKEQVKRTLLPTKAEKQAETERTLRQTRGAPVTDEFEEYYAKQEKRRETGPVSRPDVYPPREFKLGTEETSAQTRTTPEGISVKRGQKQRDVPIKSAEMQEANKAAPGATMGPKPETSMQAMRQEQQLFDTAQKKVEELNTKLSNIKERVAAYSKLEKKKAGVQERLADEQKSIATELAGAKADAARLAPKTGTVSQQTEGTLEGEFEGRARENSPDYELRDTVDLTGTALEAVQDGRVLDALDAVGANSNSPFVKELVKNLRPLVMRTKLRVEDNVTVRGKRAEGVYDFETNTVTIDSDALTEEALLHEVTHAVTTRLLTVDPSQLTKEQRAARAELEKLFKSIQNDKAFENEYGKKDIHEFASEVMSNKVLRDKLAARTWHGTNLLQKIYRALLNFIGFKTENMADASVGNIYKLFTPSTTAAKAGITMSPAGIAHPSAMRYAPGLDGAGAIIDKVVAKQRGAIDKIRASAGGLLGAETQIVNRHAPLERLSKGMDERKASQMLYYVTAYDYRTHLSAQSLSQGAVQLVAKKRADGHTEYIIESVKGANFVQVAEILKKAPAGSPDAPSRLFTFYLAGLRAKNKGFQALHFGDELTEAELNTVMNQIRAVPGLEANFEQARKVYNEFNRNQINFLAQSGFISKEHAARLTKENDYIPFYREQNGVALLTIGGETPIRIGSIAEQPYLHELVGGKQRIFDITVSAVQNTQMLLDMALGNLAKKSALNELENIGLAQIRPGPGVADPNVMRFKRDGKDYHAIIDTDSTGVPADLLVKSMQGIPTQLPAVIKLASIPANFIRKMVMISPLQAGKQLFRDSIAAPLLSGADFVPVLGALNEINIFGKPSVTKTTLESRGVTGGQVFTGTSEEMTKLLQNIVSGKGNIGAMIARAEAITMEADASTRRAQYNSYIKQGLSEMEATLATWKSMDFQQRGLSPSMHMLNSMVPYLNSQVQSLAVVYKALMGKMPFNDRLKIQQKFVTRGLMIAAGSLAYAAMMQDDEAYKNATPEQKYGYWFLRFPGLDEPIKFPIPYEIGYLFKALPEAIYNSMANEHGSEEALKALNTIILQTLPGGTSMATVQYKGVNIPITPPIPQALKPGIEAALGKSFYTGRDILSRREQQVLPEQQFREGTSEIAKMMGSGLGLSPIKIDALINGYTGGMGLAFIQALSMGVPTGESPEKTAKRLSDMPVVGGLFQPNDAGGIIDAVYERMDDVKKVKTTVDRMLAEGRVAEAKELISKRSDEFAQAGVADYFISNMQQITKFENAIRASNLSGEEKRTKLDETRQMKIRLAETVRQATDAAKKVD
jgi:hypothetical protein